MNRQSRTRRLDHEARHGRKFSARRPLRFEALEQRRMLAITVDTTLDVVDMNDGVTSLREAIAEANATPAADTIDFAAALTAAGPATILLAQGELAITAPLVIDGPAAKGLTIDAQQLSRIFNITANSGDFTIDDVTLIHGRTTGDNPVGVNTFSGGAIRSLSTGMLTFSRVVLADNGTTGVRASGGAVFAAGKVTMTDSLASGNFTSGSSAGGGALLVTADAVIQRSAVSGNRTEGAASAGGGVAGLANVSLLQSAVSGNTTMAASPSVGGVVATKAIFVLQSVVMNNVGSGLQSTGSDVTITQGTVSGNSLVGVSALSKNVTTVDSTISGNNGGIVAAGIVSLLRSTVTGNHATSASIHAGGAYSSGALGVAHAIHRSRQHRRGRQPRRRCRRQPGRGRSQHHR